MGVEKYLKKQAEDKARGIARTYPEHAGKEPKRRDPPAAGAPPRVSLPCPDATPLTAKERHALGLDDRTWNRCEHPARPLGKEIVCPCQGCGPSCPGYPRDDREEPARSAPTAAVPPAALAPIGAAPPVAPARPDDPPCGVAIGSYHWPELVELQCRVIRHTCGPVPILVSADDPDTYDALRQVCARYPDVDLVTNEPRIGHSGGDMAVFHRGAAWGEKRGLKVVCKLSQRFIGLVPYWLQDGATELLASRTSTSSQRATGIHRYPLRTEAVLMDVAQWSHPDVLERTKPRKYWGDTPKGVHGEVRVWRIVEDLMDGQYWPWKLMDEERFRPNPNFLWHNGNTVADYRALGERHGITLPDDFHVDGWQEEYAKGLYEHG